MVERVPHFRGDDRSRLETQKKQASLGDSLPASPRASHLLHLQRTAGNSALCDALGKGRPRSGAALSGRPVVQRAIGFEFEFGTWATTHKNDGSRLEKGEAIIRGNGYKIEGEDGPGDNSAIEAVTKPYVTVDEATASIAQAQDKLQKIKKAGGDDDPAKTVNAAGYGGSANVDIVPGEKKGKMQASPAIALDKMAELFEQGTGSSYKGFVAAVDRHLRDKKLRKKYLGGHVASDELKGFLLLVLSYIEQGSRKQALFYPKSAFTIMARTSFTKMFSLVPEHAFFSNPKNIDKWVGLVLELAQRIFPSFRQQETGKLKKKGPFGLGGIKRDAGGMAIKATRKRSLKEIKNEPVLGMPLMGMDPLPGDAADTGYTSTTTRKDWLAEMPTSDLLSKSKDKRFEGMGGYGDAVDVEVTEEDVVRETEEAVEQAVSSLNIPTEDGAKGKAPTKAPKQAPLFELRGLRDMFGVDQDVSLDEDWAEKVTEIFTIVDKANQGSFKPGGKPTIPPDVDDPSLWKKQR